MRIPDRLLTEITIFASEHYAGNGLFSPPQMMASSCGVLAAEWIDRGPYREALQGLDRTALVSMCERFGKHLGVFYLSEKED